PAIFWATAGGMGLTGLITRVTLRLLRIETSLMRVQTQRARDLGEVMEVMAADHSRYSAAWIDALATGSKRGRGVVVTGDHATAEDAARLGAAPALGFTPARSLRLPGSLLGPLARRGIAAANAAVYARAPASPRESLQTLPQFFHTHDAVDLFHL